MSAIKIDTSNIIIYPYDIIDMLALNKRYINYNKEVLAKIAIEVISEYKKAVMSEKASDQTFFDDELLFDDIFDYMLKRLGELFTTYDIAYLVNDIFNHLEDIFFDEGCIEYFS